MPVVPCSPRPIAAVAPVPAGKKGAVHHVVAPLGHLLRGEQQILQGPDDHVGHDPDGPRDRGPGGAQLLSDHRLYHIETFSPEPMAQRPGSAWWCGRDWAGVEVESFRV